MSPRHFRSSRPVRPQRRKLVWATSQFTHNAVASGTTHVDDLLAGYKSLTGSTQGVTIMRIHLQGSYAPASVGGLLNLGLIIDTLFDVSGAGTDPPPTQVGDDWMLNTVLYPGSNGATVNAVNPFVYDIKSKRKCEELQQTLAFSAQPTDSGTSSWNYQTRVLLALP